MKTIPYDIDENIYQRFDQKNNMIYRPMWDQSLPTYRQMFFTNIEKHIESNKEGYTRFDFAFVKAAWTVYKKFPFALAWKPDSFNLGDFSTSYTYFTRNFPFSKYTMHIYYFNMHSEKGCIQ